MRREPSIVHVDLDAFFASVEQRDKPSLRGRPVIVGGTGLRGVVSTASYEARVYGARSAMSTAEARAICPPGTAFLSPRFDAYRKSSIVVMELLRELSPLVEQVSIDEAYVDLRGADLDELTSESVRRRLERLDADIRHETGGLTASAGAASSKMLAKIASDLDKPNGITVIAAGREQETLDPLSIRVISGIGPATASRLKPFGVETVSDLLRMSEVDLVSVFGDRQGRSLHALARAEDDRELSLSREAKSISHEETFERDVHERVVLHHEIDKIADSVVRRMEKAGVFGRTVHLKVRLPDFSVVSRSFTLSTPTRDAEEVARNAARMLDALDLPAGVRLVGVGVSGFVQHSQEGLFALEESAPADLPEYPDAFAPVQAEASPEFGDDGALPLSTRFSPSRERRWVTGMDIVHTDHGAGWVWGAGRSRVTVRFEGPTTGPGRVLTFPADDVGLQPGEAPEWRPTA